MIINYIMVKKSMHPRVLLVKKALVVDLTQHRGKLGPETIQPTGRFNQITEVWQETHLTRFINDLDGYSNYDDDGIFSRNRRILVASERVHIGFVKDQEFSVIVCFLSLTVRISLVKFTRRTYVPEGIDFNRCDHSITKKSLWEETTEVQKR